MSSLLTEILIGESAGDALVSIPSAHLEAGKGVVGDRYYDATGTFSAQLEGTPDFEITLIEQEEITRFNETHGRALTAADLRRNLVTTGVRLNDLVGQEFQVGSVTLKGIRLCEPCGYLAGLLGKDVLDHMVHKAGLRAQIVNDGQISVGDAIQQLAKPL